MGKNIFEVSDKGEEKCGGCNYRTTNIYVLAESREEAKRLYNQGEAGMCSECLVEWLKDKEAEINL